MQLKIIFFILVEFIYLAENACHKRNDYQLTDDTNYNREQSSLSEVDISDWNTIFDILEQLQSSQPNDLRELIRQNQFLADIQKNENQPLSEKESEYFESLKLLSELLDNNNIKKLGAGNLNENNLNNLNNKLDTLTNENTKNFKPEDNYAQETIINAVHLPMETQENPVACKVEDQTKNIRNFEENFKLKRSLNQLKNKIISPLKSKREDIKSNEFQNEQEQEKITNSREQDEVALNLDGDDNIKKQDHETKGKEDEKEIKTENKSANKQRSQEPSAVDEPNTRSETESDNTSKSTERENKIKKENESNVQEKMDELENIPRNLNATIDGDTISVVEEDKTKPLLGKNNSENSKVTKLSDLGENQLVESSEDESIRNKEIGSSNKDGSKDKVQNINDNSKSAKKEEESVGGNEQSNRSGGRNNTREFKDKNYNKKNVEENPSKELHEIITNISDNGRNIKNEKKEEKKDEKDDEKANNDDDDKIRYKSDLLGLEQDSNTENKESNQESGTKGKETENIKEINFKRVLNKSEDENKSGNNDNKELDKEDKNTSKQETENFKRNEDSDIIEGGEVEKISKIEEDMKKDNEMTQKPDGENLEKESEVRNKENAKDEIEENSQISAPDETIQETNSGEKESGDKVQDENKNEKEQKTNEDSLEVTSKETNQIIKDKNEEISNKPTSHIMKIPLKK